MMCINQYLDAIATEVSNLGSDHFQRFFCSFLTKYVIIHENKLRKQAIGYH